MFSWWDNLSAIFTFQILGLVKGTQIGDAVHFFIFDTVRATCKFKSNQVTSFLL